MTLKDQFILHFKNQNEITTKEILNWYKSVKKGKKHTYHSTIYSIIINPLIDENRIKSISRGVYIIINNKYNPIIIKEKGGDDSYQDMNNDELDELDEYLLNQIKKKG